MKAKPSILFQTDFGLTCGYPGIVCGVIKKVDPELEIYDLNHNIRQFDIRHGAESLLGAIDYWPEGTVILSVVDPGVGTNRRSCVAKLDNGSYLVTPDNGTLTFLRHRITQVREIDETVNRLPGSENDHTFHARDVYGYTAARLASGIISYEEVGPSYPVSDCVVLTINHGVTRPGYGQGEIANVDSHFGSVTFSFDRAGKDAMGLQVGDTVRVTITKGGETLFDEDVACRRTFGEVPVGAPVICIHDSRDRMGIDLNQRSFAYRYLPRIFDVGEVFSEYKVTVKKQ